MHWARALMVAVLATACAPAPAPESKIVIAYGVAPQTMDPQMHQNTVTESVLRSMFDTLTVRGADMKSLEPGLALSWQQLSEITWQFKLRQGVKFHNGEEFNAEAVKVTFDRARNPYQNSPCPILVTPTAKR